MTGLLISPRREGTLFFVPTATFLEDVAPGGGVDPG
jgi:hypothetical protein